MKLPTINLNHMIGNTLRFIKANKTTLYAAGASVGVIGTGVTCARAALKSKDFLDEYPDATKKEKAAYLAGLWITPVVVGGVTIFCIWRGHKIHMEKEASLAAMSAYWKKKHNDLEKKVTEKLGEDGAREIKEEIFREQMDTNADLPKGKLPDGAFWIYDEITDQFIMTNPQRFNWALYSINQDFAAFKDVDYNKFLKLIGGKPDPRISHVGWSYNNLDQIDMMDYNGLGYWIEIIPDYYTIESKNKELDGIKAATLFFNYEPDYYSSE